MINQEEETFLNNNEELQWKSLFNSKNFWKFNHEFFPRYKHVELKPSPYLLSLILSYLAFYIYYYDIYPNLKYKTNFKLYFNLFFLIYGIIFLTITQFVDPGYLPFNWSINQKKEFNQKEFRNGIALTYEQKEFGKNSIRPSRACFSTRSGLYILRADHFCGWANNWIGLKNHRYFIISIFNLFIFNLLFFIDFILTIIYKSNKIKNLYFYLILILIFLFLFFLFNLNISQFWQITYNSTSLEIMKGIYGKYFNFNILNSWEEIFGKKNFFLWFLPLPTKLIIDGFNYEKFSDDENLDDIFVCPYKKIENNNKPLL